MFIRLFLLLSFVLSVSLNAHAQSEWVGKWNLNKIQDIKGSLNISSCHKNSCTIDLFTFYGAHSCHIEEKIKISENIGILKANRGDKTIDIQFVLNKQKNEIEVTSNIDAKFYFCGMRAYFDGIYENSKKPIYYSTGFDCKSSKLTITDRTICMDKELASANKELLTLFPLYQMQKQLKEKNLCSADKKCLYNYYKKALRQAYTTKFEKPFSLYDYINDAITQTQNYNLKSYLFINEILKNKMVLEDYEVFSAIDIDYVETSRENGIYVWLGVPGLYQIMESVIHLDIHGQLRIAFLSPDGQGKNDLIIYLPDISDKSNLPKQFAEWIQSHKKDNEIVYKQFSIQEKKIVK